MGIITYLAKQNRPAPKPRARKAKAPARAVGAGPLGARMYQTAKQSRLTAGWGTSNTSADSELVTSLTALRNRSRALVRDSAYAKRAKTIIVNNVIGAAIGMQAQVKTARGKLNQRVNDAIEDAWTEWAGAERCHTGGELDFADLERQAMGQVFEAGEVIVREHYAPLADSAVPYALELIEAERIADEFQFPSLPVGPTGAGTILRMGVEVDRFYRPVAAWIRERHPGELRFQAGIDRLERVPIEQLHHLRVIDRWPQTRGEPWMHAVARKLNDMDGYSEAEIIAARAAACYMGVVEQPEGDNPLGGHKQDDGSFEVTLESGVVVRLRAGEKFSSFMPNRPNAAMDPFMRLMLREVAAGVGPSYESLSRDYSQSNYSSSRLALLDDRDLWRVLQGWFIRRFRAAVHRRWLQQAVLARAISAIAVEEYALNRRKFEAVRFKTRGWSWIDPNKEVEAFKAAENAGYLTKTQIIAQTGNGYDLEDVLDEREQELALIKEKGLSFDTSPNPAAAPKPDDTDTDTDDPPARVVSFKR
jgi:lambda family phage portal protein